MLYLYSKLLLALEVFDMKTTEVKHQSEIHRSSRTHVTQKPAKNKSKAVKVSKALRFLALLNKVTFWAVIIFGSVLTVTTVIGGLFFDLQADTVASWFVFTLVLIFAALSVFAFVTFIIWYWRVLLTPILLVVFIALIIGASLLFITPDITPFIDAFELIGSYFSFLVQ